MAYTLTQYQMLVDAIAQGALIVKYADKEVRYRSLDEMIRIKQQMEIDLNIATKPKVRYAQHSKGLI
jgi:hypothetical protein